MFTSPCRKVEHFLVMEMIICGIIEQRRNCPLCADLKRHRDPNVRLVDENCIRAGLTTTENNRCCSAE
jgi:hypothetical protein